MVWYYNYLGAGMGRGGYMGGVTNTYAITLYIIQYRLLFLSLTIQAYQVYVRNWTWDGI